MNHLGTNHTYSPLQERLRSHAKAFDGLLQLIPAKIYYGEDTSVGLDRGRLSLKVADGYQDQWCRKKQTKEEARIAKLAKLDPDNAKTAKDVMDENARKRKRDEVDDEEPFDLGDIDLEQPLQKSKKASNNAVKRKKRDINGSSVFAESNTDDKNGAVGFDIAEESVRKAKAEARREKAQRKKAKEAKKMAKREAKKAHKELQPPADQDTKVDVHTSDRSDEDDDPRTGDISDVDVSGIFDTPNERPASTATPSPGPQSPIFDNATVLSGSSSISSIAPPTELNKVEPEEPSHETNPPKPSPEELKARLQKRIEELRAARKADGLNGKPARNRQELLDARRRKEEQRKAHKKELRQKAKEEEREKQRSLMERGSPLLNSLSGSNAIKPPSRDSDSTTNLTFGRIAFPDGHRTTAELSTILPSKPAKGPQDPFTALQAAQKKQTRLNGFDPDKRAEIAEKDMWLHAHKHALGERVRDDTSLLKKTLKRKESAKRKSEKEWTGRIEGVEKAKASKQRRREENLKKRRDEKGAKGKGKKGGKGKPKPKARPGFEGSFRTKAPTGMGAGGGTTRRK